MHTYLGINCVSGGRIFERNITILKNTPTTLIEEPLKFITHGRIFELVVYVTSVCLQRVVCKQAQNLDIHAYISYMNKALPLANTNSCTVQKQVHFQACFSEEYEKRMPSNRAKME